MKHFRQTFAEIHLGNLKHNYHLLLSLNQELGGGFFCPMIKSDGYGHGMLSIAKALEGEGASHFGVSLVEEANILRDSGIATDILVFGGFSFAGAQRIIEIQCTPVIGCWEQWRIFNQVLCESNVVEPWPIHIKWDTGMSRMGFQLQDIDKVKEDILSCSRVSVVGVGTHFMSGEDIEDPDGESIQQLKEFKFILDKVKNTLKGDVWIHCFNSASSLGGVKLMRQGVFPKDLVGISQGIRPGLALYGVLPENIEQGSFDLRPVMSLKGEVISVRNVKKGRKVSYGGSWQAGRDSLLALIFCGYADGYPFRLSNKSLALYKGERVPQVGRVCMGYTLFDVTALADKGNAPKEGEVFTLFGEDGGGAICVNELAQRAGMIPYEILTGITARVPRFSI